jgi:hypothetical protein
LFAGLENETMEPANSELVEVVPTPQEQNGLPLASEEVPVVQEEKRSPWMLKEKDGFTNDIGEYRLRKRKALLSVLEDMESGSVYLSRRVIGIWAYQRGELKRVS